jgi:hypothetical protein
MNDLLDDNSYSSNHGDSGFSALGKSRMKVVASSVFTVSIIQLVLIGLAVLGGLVFVGTNVPSSIFAKLLVFVFFGFFAFYVYTLFQYGQKLTNFVQYGKQNDLEQALAKRKLYWTIGGIFAILGLCYNLFILTTAF